jgi:hypothetical protein
LELLVFRFWVVYILIWFWLICFDECWREIAAGRNFEAHCWNH